jgi:oxygen-independent coproporphyrinogen-3 oxidase
VLPLSMMRQILAAIMDAFRPPAGVEITVEANPGTVDHEYLDGLREAGVNRLSIGVQSFDDAELRLLGRIHDRQRALETLTDARAAGFERLNLDLIFGLPGQTLSDWQHSLNQALECQPGHMSLYALSLEEGTPLAGQVACGALPAPDGDLAAEMYELAGAMLAGAGYEQYEISNWSLPGYESRHNLQTWRNGAYLGFGPAAHSHLGRRRWWNVADPEAYIARIEAGQSARAGEEELDAATDMAETIILGLRLVRDGVDIATFRRRYEQTPADLYGPILDELVEWGLLEVTPARIRLSPRGRLLGNQVFARFLPE